MDENNGYFRIATTKGSVTGMGDNASRNNMYVLDMDLKLDGIAGGILVEKTEKKKVDADQKKRMYASAFAYIRSQTGMNKKEFAEYLGIPYRTLQDWELGNTQAPEYVLRLIAYKVQMEKERGNL